MYKLKNKRFFRQTNSMLIFSLLIFLFFNNTKKAIDYLSWPKKCYRVGGNEIMRLNAQKEPLPHSFLCRSYNFFFTKKNVPMDWSKLNCQSFFRILAPEAHKKYKGVPLNWQLISSPSIYYILFFCIAKYVHFPIDFCLKVTYVGYKNSSLPFLLLLFIREK